MALTARLIEDPAALEAHVPAWDVLAVTAGRPACAPGWALAWWATAAPAGARLCVAVALDGDDLVGIAPAYRERRRGRPSRLRLLAAPVSARVEPLAVPGREQEAAAALARALAGTRAGALELAGLDGRKPWPQLLAASWPAGARAVLRADGTAPVLALGGGVEAWRASRSANFRSQMKRARRQLEERGGRLRVASTPADVDRGLEALIRLHHARWEERGGSGAMTPGVERMLREAARRMEVGARYRLWLVEAGDEVISSHLFLAAGEEVTYWLGGHDDAWGRYRPSLLAILAALEEAFAGGERRFDLGHGEHEYKQRFTSDADALEWWSVVPRGPRALAVRAEQTAQRARDAAAARAPDRLKDAVRRLPRP